MSLLAKEFVTPFQKIQQHDPILRFKQSLEIAAISLEMRTDDELEVEARLSPDPVLREQALYQLIDRKGVNALPFVENAIFSDNDQQLRINLLWALEDIGSQRCADIAISLTNDRDDRVQEWARVFCWEMGWIEQDFRRAREATIYQGRTFDQTIFLHIKCDLYIRLQDNNTFWGHILLSPQMLARVYGQAHACPITKTRERELVIGKTLSGLHDDGTDHYEAFLFRGFTERTNPLTGNFYFEVNADRPFYLSGKADDISEGVIDNVPITFAREGQWFLNDKLNIGVDLGDYPIEYVRGLFQGWAYVNMDRVMNNEGNFLFPGNSILSTPYHAEVGPKTNVFITGSFKGKVLDWDADGILDLNYLPVHATAKGEVDSNLDGIADIQGRSVCPRPLDSSRLDQKSQK